MTSRSVTVPNRLGMHARAAARFVRLAGQFHSRVEVSRGPRTTDGKSILGLLLLAASQGAALQISATGPDELAAVARLCEFVQTGFGEAS